MLLLKNNQVTFSLDPFLDIENFLSLKDEFYYLFANNYQKTKDVWNAGGIPFELNWKYLTEHPMLYKTFHLFKDVDPYINKLPDKTAIAYYLKLKYGCFSPYKILHLNEYKQPLEDWVTPAIKDWIGTLPYSSIDHISFFFNDHFCPLKYHRDYNYFPVEHGYSADPPDTLQDIIWLRFDTDRGFNFYDIDDNGNIIATYPVQGYSSTFNHYNWHGNTEHSDVPSLTVKLEGTFTKEFKEKIYG